MLLLGATLFSMFSTAGVLGVVIHENGISAQQQDATVTIIVVDCSGNPIGGAVVQLQRLIGWGQWTYTSSKGAATFSGVPSGTYTVQGGNNNAKFSQTITVGTGDTTLTVTDGNNCGITTTTTTTTI